MFVCHATKKLLDRARPASLVDPTAASTTLLGSWYATALFWRPQVALLVSEATLLPVLLPVAPAVRVLERFPRVLAEVLTAHGVDQRVITAELAEMGDACFAKTANRSVLGVLVELGNLAGAWRGPDVEPDLLGLSLRLATVPCRPLYARHVSPDRELAALVEAGRG